MTLANLKNQILKSELNAECLKKELTGLRNQVDSIFLDDCLKLLSANDPKFDVRFNSSVLLEYAKEKLNIGHWRNVANGWRVAYFVIRVFIALYRLNWLFSLPPTATEHLVPHIKQTLMELDYGLIMGFASFNSKVCELASALNNFIYDLDPTEALSDSRLSTLASFQNVKLANCSYNKEKISSLRRIYQPSMTEFLEILDAGIPVIITGAMQHWPALKSNGAHAWSLDYWSKVAGNRTVPIEVGSAYTDESWGQRLITFNRFLKEFIVNPSNTEDSPKGYLAQYQLFLQIPEFSNDVDIPDYCYLGKSEDCESVEIDSNLWVGPEGTVSPLHHDGERANLLCQVVGSKYVKLYTAGQTEYVYPYPNSLLSNTSRVNVVAPNLSEFPKFASAFGFHGILSAGEMLFIPSRCWHYIESKSVSISINFWWTVASKFVPSWPSSESEDQPHPKEKPKHSSLLTENL